MIKTTGRYIFIESVVLFKHLTSKKSEVRGLAERWKERSCCFLKDKHEIKKKSSGTAHKTTVWLLKGLRLANTFIIVSIILLSVMMKREI